MEPIVINKKRILDEFAELVAIDSESFHERAIANVVKEKLEAIGFEVHEDLTGLKYDSDTGNIYGYLKGEADSDTVLLSAHLDTVAPGNGKKAIFKDGVITSDGTTVLGSDDVAGIVEILEGIRSLKEAGISHKNIEVLFPIAEEPYTKGAAAFDYSLLKSKKAYCLDLSGSVGTAAVKAPSLISFKATVKGRASHAGFAPEEGINAIAIAATAISRIRQGQIDEDTTLNIGTITGGIQTNIVSDLCICEGELRSFNHEKALKELEELKRTFEKEADSQKAQFAFEYTIHLVAYEVEKAESVVLDFEKACEALEIEPKLVSTLGGADNHKFNLNGIKGLVLSCGMEKVHTTDEFVRIADLENGARLVNLIARA